MLMVLQVKFHLLLFVSCQHFETYINHIIALIIIIIGTRRCTNLISLSESEGCSIGWHSNSSLIHKLLRHRKIG